MLTVRFFENNLLVLSQLVDQLPAVDNDIKIKGRKGKIVNVKKLDQNLFHVDIKFETVLKKKALVPDNKKKRR
ncbi:hypothetical protein [Heyndrickxia acidiproducens]|uniref:hypothetical protein n=1 Tax=Heyndrickxia acidiproducens TaxID=1121084 RepID=UPI0003635406|nr:hypothetical protein [Heyndrickxia acidiproducens]